MIKAKHFRRLFGLAAVLFLVFMSLGARLVFLQVVRHDHYRKIADYNTQSLSVRPARRGDILDARGNPLAVSLPVKRVIANPAFMGTHYLEVAHRLAPLLAYQESDLAQRLRPTVVRTNQFGLLLTNQYVDLKRKLTIEQWQQVTQSMATLRLASEPIKPTGAQKQFYRALREQSVFPVDDQYRYYPNTNLASHVIGYAQDTETNFNSNVTVRELTGRDGIEAWLDAKLRGVHGWRITETDHGKREIFAAREQEVDARPGLNVVLTLDSVIQSIVEAEIAEAARKHSPLSVSSMVVRPRTGEILAMATLPNYDPNQPGRAPLDALRNRMISDVVEPGSTFKIVVVSAALNENVVTLDDTFDCEMGNFRFLGHILHDHDHHGVITVENIITHSSNIGSAKIGIRLGKDLLDQYIRRFGFGAKTGITLGGELPGIVHPLSYYEKDKLLISRIPMGQAIAVTPLQMTMAMCAIANEGRVMRPMLVSRLQDPEGNVCAQYEPQVVREAVRPEAARLLVSALKTVVAKGGTAPQAAMDHYTVAGKTGTAWKVVDRVYVRGKYISSFIGFFPADNPEVCISVFFDEPKNGYYGGSTAAPVFRKIADQVANYLKIKPEQQEPGTDTEAALGTLKTASLAGPQ